MNIDNILKVYVSADSLSESYGTGYLNSFDSYALQKNNILKLNFRIIGCNIMVQLDKLIE